MAIKLKAATGLTIDGADLREILTDYLCSGSYGAFADLEVASVVQAISGDFELSLHPRPAEQAA